jgi:hypothetical protein
MIVALGILLLLVGLLAPGRGGVASSLPTGMMLHLIEHPSPETQVLIDLGKKGDSVGDQIAFGNPIFNAQNTERTGIDSGLCVRTEVGVMWECFLSILLPRGHITVEGPFYDKADSLLAVTGGTGAYRTARGEMKLHARADGTYDFILMIL